jgi:hypothetical protein
MTSPFIAYANATIFVPVPGSTVERDTSGNWSVTGGSEIEVRALLNMSSRRGQGSTTTRNEPGVDGAVILVDGYLVEPMFFPSGIEFPNRFRCETRVGTDTVSGTLEVKASLPSAFGVEIYTGQKISGSFTVEDGA